MRRMEIYLVTAGAVLFIVFFAGFQINEISKFNTNKKQKISVHHLTEYFMNMELLTASV
jgi:hypothetical protein